MQEGRCLQKSSGPEAKSTLKIVNKTFQATDLFCFEFSCPCFDPDSNTFFVNTNISSWPWELWTNHGTVDAYKKVPKKIIQICKHDLEYGK